MGTPDGEGTGDGPTGGTGAPWFATGAGFGNGDGYFRSEDGGPDTEGYGREVLAGNGRMQTYGYGAGGDD